MRADSGRRVVLQRKDERHGEKNAKRFILGKADGGGRKLARDQKKQTDWEE